MSEEKKPEVRSYVERFGDIEKSVAQHQQGLQQTEIAINFHSRVIQELMNEIRQLNQTLAGIMKTAENKSLFTLDEVVSTIAETNAQRLKDKVAQDEKDGKIIPVDSVEDANTLVVFSALPDFLYGYSMVDSFNDKEVSEQIIGKKVGDKVKDVEILALYRLKQEEAQANESEQN